MRTSEYVIFSMTLIFAGCLVMGCSSLPFMGQPQQGTFTQVTGFAPGNQSYEPPSYTSFNNAISNLAEVEFADSNGTFSGAAREKEILYIQGDGVDSSGNADRWMFAVHHANTTSLVTYNHGGRSIVSWPVGFSGPVIHTDQIIFPRNLMDQNNGLISGYQSANETLSWKMVLENGNYTLSPSGGASRILIFNATTGVLISSHE